MATTASSLSQVSSAQKRTLIAAALGCAENTVEAHVTQLLAKAGLDKRSGLLFRFWSQT